MQTTDRYIIVVFADGSVRPMRAHTPANFGHEQHDGSEFAHITEPLTLSGAAEAINDLLRERGNLPQTEVDVVSRLPSRLWRGGEADRAPRWMAAG